MSKTQKLNRRDFIKSSLLGAGALALPSWLNQVHAQATDRPMGANGDIRVAVIGIRGQGNSHINDLLKIPGTRIVALCDVDSAVLRQRVAELEKKEVKVKAYTDMRALFDDPEIDAVSMATPNHWHSLGTIWACQAGKDVYVEKPVSHNVNEAAGWWSRPQISASSDGTQYPQPRLQKRWHGVRADNLGKISIARAPDVATFSCVQMAPGPPEWITISGAVRPRWRLGPQAAPL